MNWINQFNWLDYIGYPYIENPSVQEWNGQAVVTLSYDDGFMSNYTIALRLHEKYKLPLTLNILGYSIGSMSRQEALNYGKGYMHSREVINSDKRGAEIASHGYGHTYLTEQTEEQIIAQFHNSKSTLEQFTEHDVVTFAVPGSQYTQVERDIVDNSVIGYKGVRSFGSAYNDLPPLDPLWLKSKIALMYNTSFETVKLVIDEAVVSKKWCIIMLHGIAENPVEYEISPEMLEMILSYIASFNKSELLCANTRDVLNWFL